MTDVKYLDCIVCPLSCKLKVTLENGEICSVEGNSCPRGEKYAAEELTAPQRILTTTVKIHDAILPLLPVVSDGSLPKEKIIDCAVALRAVNVYAPVRLGQIIVPNILGLGVDIVASRSMDKI